MQWHTLRPSRPHGYVNIVGNKTFMHCDESVTIEHSILCRDINSISAHIDTILTLIKYILYNKDNIGVIPQNKTMVLLSTGLCKLIITPLFILIVSINYVLRV